MSLLNQPTAGSDYTFASTGIDDFITDFSRQKQETGVNSDSLNDIPDFEPEPEQEPLPDLKAKAGVAKATGALLTTVLDTTLSTAIAMYAGDEPANYKADPEQRDDLQAAISEYVKLKGGDIPPGIALMILVLTIYGGKFAQGFQFRKLRKENDEQAKRIAELEKKEMERQKRLNEEPDDEPGENG